MNILFVTSHLRKGGPVNVIYSLCREFSRLSGTKVVLLTLRKEGAGSKLPDFKKEGIRVIALNHSYGQCELLASMVRKEIQKVVNELNIDIVHSHGYHAAIACCGLKKVKLVATLHDRAKEDFLNVFGPFVGRYMLKRYYSALRRFDANVAVSDSTAEAYSGILPHLSYVNNGIDTSLFQPLAPEEREKLRKSLGIPDGASVFVSSGRIEKEKRMEELVSWFAGLPSSLNVVLYVLGAGSRLQACRELAEGHDNIHFTGQLSNVRDYLQASDFYISYSKSEGMSLAVCEGVACGLTPVLSNIPSHHDMVDMVGGFLFDDFKNIDMSKILKNRKSTQLLYEETTRHFSVQSMTQGYLKVYNELIEQTTK